MTQALFPSPSAGFDEPLELWQACHERVERMLALLTRLSTHLGTNGADEEARNAATSVRRYFDEAAPRHHEDEEINLFPCLLANTHGPARTRLSVVITALTEEHRSLDSMWSSLRASLQAIESGSAVAFDAALLVRFVNGYRRHLDVEDTVLLPALTEALNEETRRAIGLAMALRRGAILPSKAP